jgi:dihydroorotate dehydrogenase (NAD+) catalytic subunit
VPDPDLTTRIGGLTLSSPVLTASGTFGYASEHLGLVDFARLGGVITKGISPEPRSGTAQPRIWETPSGMMNAIGLENVGLEAFGTDKLPFLRTIDCAVVVNYFAETLEAYATLAGRLAEMEGVDALEANISCPNVKAGGRQFGVDPRAAAAVTSACRATTSKPLIVKLSPDVSDIGEMARAVAGAGADALTVANSIPAMAIDIRTRRPRLSFGRGGLTGPAIRPISMRLVHDASKAVDIPVLASGGASTWEHAVEYLLAGASAVQVGTATFVNPRAAVEMVDGLERYCAEEGVSEVSELIGAMETG